MKLLRLRVRGLRSFTKETEIDLARLGEHGLFAVSGPTGAGKSTILDGIFLALFGRCPRGEAGECVSAGALELTVRLEIAVDREPAREIAVERRFRWSKRRDADAAALGGDLRGASRHPPLRIEERKDGAWTSVDLGGRRAEEHLREQIVRVSLSDFQQAVVLPQGQFDALLHAKPAERRTLVASLFRTEHLGHPFVEVLKARESAVKNEIGRLQEAVREVAATADEVAAAATLATTLAARATALVEALSSAERRAVSLRIARQRCAARDASAEALARALRELEARARDRSRVELGKKAAGAWGALVELERGEAAARAAEARAVDATLAAPAAEARRAEAARALAEASAARADELPALLEQLGRARLAEERGQDLEALEADRVEAAAALAAATEALAAARAVRAETTAALAAAEDEERAAAARLDAARVGEDERAEAAAAVAIAERATGEARLDAVIAAERAAAQTKVDELAAMLSAAEEAARLAEGEAARCRAEQGRREIDRDRAAAEVERAERAMDASQKAAAAASLAADLRAGQACPVCGSHEHPGADHRAASVAIDRAERAVEAARRGVRAAERAASDAVREASARDEEARAQAGRVEIAAAEVGAAADLLARQISGEAPPRAVIEARLDVERLAAKADAAIAAVPADRRDSIRAPAIALAAAEARLAALGKRARDAEQLAGALGVARDRAARARVDLGHRSAEVDAAERAAIAADARHAGAASVARARRDEIRALLADLESPEPAIQGKGRARGRALRGQRGLFDPAPRVRTASEWIDEIEAKTTAIVSRAELAEAALEEARAAAERLALEAREAAARRDEAAAVLARAEAAIADAIARAGFDDRAALRAARVDPAELAGLEAELGRLDRDRERLHAVHAERLRDVDVEVTEPEALAAEQERDAARTETHAAQAASAEAAVRRDDLARRHARTLEIGARIALLEPRARRIGQIRQVVAGNQLAELAAQRHLEAVTRGAAVLLKSLSSDRYALVRNPEGAFAVADAAHGNLVRPPSTLSGGETFLVSLALALSLSERIQLAGRTRFDFFFLDEGFGSLDAGTLDVALGALERLRGPHRVIGMISHVAAIEERMPRRLRVVPARPGGSATVVHEPADTAER